MKKALLNKIEKAIRKQYPKYDDDKIAVIMYGIEGLYITITKTIVIFALAFFLGIFKSLLLLLLFFNGVRLFAFGMHAPNGIVCLIISTLLFIGIAYLSTLITIPSIGLFIIYGICFMLMLLFAPADTIKRPLIKKKKRVTYKILSLTITAIYFLICLFINNSLIINSITFGLIIECILINPLTYKLFKLPFNNYKTYGLNVK